MIFSKVHCLYFGFKFVCSHMCHSKNSGSCVMCRGVFCTVKPWIFFFKFSILEARSWTIIALLLSWSDELINSDPPSPGDYCWSKRTALLFSCHLRSWRVGGQHGFKLLGAIEVQVHGAPGCTWQQRFSGSRCPPGCSGSEPNGSNIRARRDQ